MIDDSMKSHISECLSFIGLPCNCEGREPTTPSVPDMIRTEKVDAIVTAMEVLKTTEDVPAECLSSCIPEFAIHSQDCPNNPKRIKLPKCTACNSDIPASDIHIGTSRGKVCLDCGLCCSCGDQVTITEIEFCLKHEVMIQHSRCRMKTDKDALKIPVSEYELGILNNCRLMNYPDVEVSIETNVNTAKLAHGQIWETFTLEQKFIHVQMIEAVYSAAYMALKKDPTEIKSKLRERDMARTSEAHAQAKKDRQTQLPTEKRKMGLQEKFLKGMESSGISKEQAKAIWISQGRVWID